MQQIGQALRPFTRAGELNNRLQAQQQVEALLPQLEGDHFDKFKRLLRCSETYTYLDQLQSQVEALPVAGEIREAVVQSEGIRQNPQLVKGEGHQQGVMRGLRLVWSVLIGSAKEMGQQAVTALRQAVSCVGRASSCVEGLNSVVRMQQSRHRKRNQELLNLKRL